MLSAMGLRAAITAESQQILEPFFMGCDTRMPKMVQIAINAMQKMVIFECLNTAASNSLLICLWALMEHGIEEVKILQTITLLVTTNQLVINDQLAKTISLCIRLHYTKNPTTNNTASATIRQLVTVIFERVQLEDKKRASSESSSSETDSKSSPSTEKLLESVSTGDSVQFKPTKLNPAALDAFDFAQDLIQLINGEAPFWLPSDHHHLVEITKTFGLELLELIIEQFADVFQKVSTFTYHFVLIYYNTISLYSAAQRICISSQRESLPAGD